MTKKYILSLLFLIIASVVFAQQQISVKVWKGGKAEIIEQIDSVTFPNTMQHLICIDLGLSVKWASCNLGAETPEAYGDYYAWGEVKAKENYKWNGYKYYEPISKKITKYNTSDKKTILEASDDAATIILGNEWRIPTTAEMEELVKKCTWKWFEDEKSGYCGYWVTGPNGNRIFLPAAGCMNGNEPYATEFYGYYWTSEVVSFESKLAVHLFFDDSKANASNVSNRYYGFCIRPVRQ
jgi:non-specific serine/threonine protein kinase